MGMQADSEKEWVGMEGGGTADCRIWGWWGGSWRTGREELWGPEIHSVEIDGGVRRG